FFLQDDTRIPLVDILNKEDSLLTNAFSLYPISSVERMFSVHYYYATIEYKKYSLKADTAGNMMMEACQELPNALLDEDIVQIGCDLVRGDDQSILDSQKNLIKYRRTTRYRPINHYQYRNWRYFDTNNLYNDETTEPHHHVGLFKYLSREFRRATDQATKEINKKYAPKRYKLRTIINGFVKNDPIFGNDYIIDGKFVDVKHTSAALYERVRIFQPIQNGYTVKPSKNDASELINIVVPISDVTQRCYDYLEMFEKIYSRDDKLRLVLVIFGKNDVHDIEEKINEIRQTTPKVNIVIVKGKGNFSRAQALDQGMMTLEKNDLAFLCDVDMEVNITFFDRCRKNTNQGKMVYYPEVFKMYNSRFLNPDKNARRKHSRFRGHWGGYAFGMLCIYKSDYTKVGGLNTKMMGWGGEDVDLFQKVLKSRIEVLRAPDVGLIHRWHKRSCSKASLTENNYKQCLSSRAEALGDKRPLGHFLYLLQDMYPDLKQKLQIPV
uniref:Hexosyltransferase n=2 Tax=Amphimedon queenslandica TaxID=400682 RepID=A0A1X7UEQ7_AMPQE